MVSNCLRKSRNGFQLGTSTIKAYEFVYLRCLHRIPNLLRHQTAIAPHTALSIPSVVKYHPSPAASSRGRTMLTPIAAMAHLIILAVAAAVLGLFGKLSTNNVL